ncbi:peptidase [Cereibacter sphaeroides]|uniref:imelysin family protein n=1 Tax=Cereibacter sphaeroides TaxID=1063 RepID=UPI001F2AB6EB|nr:imelysin family protein [Cereibacter sphaeroides]MCE6951263.1 peptidase [Cereibacter sphaeroides]
MKARLLALAATAAPCALLPLPALAVEPGEVVETYADIAAATYADSLATAQELRAAVGALIAAPSEATLRAAREAWIAARVPYQQSEAFRFGNAIVDDWEGRVNAWPLDEGLIDYVDPTYGNGSEENDYAVLNVVATPKFTLSGTEVDATEITPALISGTLHEADGIEANVASGYHAIEFLLWGQDLNGTEAGAGNRPHTDYLQGEGCTGGNCDRRAAYLTAATDLLVSDLDHMVAQWAEGGAARAAVTADPLKGLQAMLTGMGSLSYGEQAGERMKLGLMLNDPEEEHDCFSDNTHNSHYYDGLGVRNVYLGEYRRVDGSLVEGPSLSDLVAGADAALDTRLKAELDASVARLDAIRSAVAGGMAYDQMLAAGNKEGEALIMAAVDALVTQTASIERATTALGIGGIEFEGSDSLDNPNAVFQ